MAPGINKMPKSDLFSAASLLHHLNRCTVTEQWGQKKLFFPKTSWRGATLCYIIAVPPSPLAELSSSFSSVVSQYQELACTHIRKQHVISHSFFVLGGGEFSCDQVSPKKAIPMAPKPKSWVAGCGVVKGAGRSRRDANVLLGWSVSLAAGTGPCWHPTHPMGGG